MDFPASHLHADFGLHRAIVVGLHQQACTGMLGALHLARLMLRSEPETARVLCVTADRFPSDALYEQSYNLIGEKALVAGLAQRLYRPGDDGLSPYLHHVLEEENKHMVYFGGFCQRYAGKIYPDRKLAMPRHGADGEDDVLFFAKVLIFEEIVDVYNRSIAHDARPVPVVRQIHLLHHREETHHLAFGRRLCKRLFARYAPTWSPETLQGVRDYLRTYLGTLWQEYYNPTVYQDAGLADPYSVRQHALSQAVCRAHRQRVSAPCLHYLVAHGMLTEEVDV